MKLLPISLLIVMLFLSGCQLPSNWTPLPNTLLTATATATLPPSTKAPLTIEDICSIVYQNDFRFGTTTVDEVERWLQGEKINYTIQIDAEKPFMKYLKMTASQITTTLVFHDNQLIATETRSTLQNSYSFGQIVAAFGPPEYFYAGLATNATPVGACEGTNCAYSVEFGYPSKGVEASFFGGTTEKMIVLDEKMKATYIVCYEPGKREQYEKLRFGFVSSITAGMDWQGFGIDIVLRQ